VSIPDKFFLKIVGSFITYKNFIMVILFLIYISDFNILIKIYVLSINYEIVYLLFLLSDEFKNLNKDLKLAISLLYFKNNSF